VAILVADGVDRDSVRVLRDTLTARGAVTELLAPVDGLVSTADGDQLAVIRRSQPSSRPA
jgi:catalase